MKIWVEAIFIALETRKFCIDFISQEEEFFFQKVLTNQTCSFLSQKPTKQNLQQKVLTRGARTDIITSLRDTDFVDGHNRRPPISYVLQVRRRRWIQVRTPNAPRCSTKRLAHSCLSSGTSDRDTHTKCTDSVWRKSSLEELHGNPRPIHR